MGSLSLSSVFSSASAVGFCGSRSAVPPVSVSSAVFSLVCPGVPVSVGCARGFDALARGVFPGASVFSVASFGAGRGAFARRSVAFVRALSLSPGAVLFSAPGVSCPAGLVPSVSSSACFCGLGSGSWASVAFALGLGVRVVVWVPSSSFLPAGWGFVSLGSGFFSAVPSQGLLF
jgi:hypothetical protein